MVRDIVVALLKSGTAAAGQWGAVRSSRPPLVRRLPPISSLELTNANITVDNSTLNGAQTDFPYEIAVCGNKNFTLGSAIFIDLADLGNHTIEVVNGSKLHGSIVTSGRAARVSVDSSTIDNGGIYLAGIGANEISVNNSTVDATNSQVATSLVALFAGTGVDLSSIDNVAIGALGGLQRPEAALPPRGFALCAVPLSFRRAAARCWRSSGHHHPLALG